MNLINQNVIDKNHVISPIIINDMHQQDFYSFSLFYKHLDCHVYNKSSHNRTRMI